jgi:DNA-binding GntR family transcriptional regulator
VKSAVREVKNTKESRGRKGSTIEEAYEAIKELMYHNQLAPGQKLIYKDLSRRLGLSSTPILQALNRLSSSGLVEYIPNRGYFVAEIDEEEARELFEARMALETHIVPRVIANLDSQKLAKIRDSFNKYKTVNAGGDRRELLLVDLRFHLEIAHYSYNRVIIRLLRDVFEQIYLKYRPEYVSAERVKAVIREHRNILGALRKSSVKEAIELTKHHIDKGMEHIIRTLPSGGVRMV